MMAITGFSQLPGSKDPTTEVWKTLKGASFPSIVKKKQDLYFSNTTKKDTIEITIDKGKISNAKLTVTIRSFDRKKLFQYSLPCSLFAYGVFNVDNISREISSDEYNAIYQKRILSTTKSSIEQFTKAKIDSFLNLIVVNEMDLERCLHLKTYDEYEQKLFMTILNDQKTFAFKWLDLDDEGNVSCEYYAFSPSKKVPVRIGWENVNAPSGYLLK
jgi:hypothetical protein